MTTLDKAIIEAFLANFRGELILPHDETYDQARRVFNGMIDRRPALIARPTGVADSDRGREPGTGARLATGRSLRRPQPGR
jgi:hypothetical protein